jgi:hypothetical protein
MEKSVDGRGSPVEWEIRPIETPEQPKKKKFTTKSKKGRGEKKK